MPSQFPVMLNVSGRLCVVIGGGDVALRKAETLLERGAVVKIISPEVRPELASLIARGIIDYEPREFRPGDLAGAFLAAAASSDPEANAQARQEANVRHVLINIADDPAGSDYQVPSFFEEGPLLIAVATGGLSPAVSRALRRMIQSYLGDSFGPALEVISLFRERARNELPSSKDRVKFWEKALTSEVLNSIRRGEAADLAERLEDELANFKRELERN